MVLNGSSICKDIILLNESKTIDEKLNNLVHEPHEKFLEF